MKRPFIFSSQILASFVVAEQFRAFLSTDEIGSDSIQRGTDDNPLVIRIDKQSYSPELIDTLTKSTNIIFADLPDVPEFIKADKISDVDYQVVQNTWKHKDKKNDEEEKQDDNDKKKDKNKQENNDKNEETKSKTKPNSKTVEDHKTTLSTKTTTHSTIIYTSSKPEKTKESEENSKDSRSGDKGKPYNDSEDNGDSDDEVCDDEEEKESKNSNKLPSNHTEPHLGDNEDEFFDNIGNHLNNRGHYQWLLYAILFALPFPNILWFEW